ncbi:hypothetical protein [Prevotella dentasini]|uniref:hypothetical protein n=1 Tax=Prevotella dentasini TaxID=589537 RepID=UPI00046807C5|nr:hypothetical protein [Prevotella dentasini]
MKINKVSLLLLFSFSVLISYAQEKFDSHKFTAEIHRYIAANAHLTQKEAARFFPVYDEMQQKRRALHQSLRFYRRQEPASEAAAKEAIQKCDELNIKMKELEKDYHAKMLKVVSAVKLSQILKAEHRFHRQFFRRIAKRNGRQHVAKRRR